MEKGIHLLAIGDELIEGRTADANIYFLGRFLEERGRRVVAGHVLRDNLPDLVSFLQKLLADPDCEGIIACGGLGPTPDDRTSEAIAMAAGVEREENQQELTLLEQKFAAFGISMSDNNRKQICLPVGAQVLANPGGTAPGFCLEVADKFVAALPGIPSENRLMAQSLIEAITPWIPGVALPEARLFKAFGSSESRFAARVAGVLRACPDVEFHDRFTFPEIELRLVSRDHEQLTAAAERVRGLSEVYGEGDTTLAAELLARLIQRQETLVVAESCTGGLLGKLLTDVPGSSRAFVGGIISYSNRLKVDLLGVDNNLLLSGGAVSTAVATSMAEGVRGRLNADWALAITGIAGPEGGSDAKPVGTTCIALSGDEGTQVRQKQFPWGREQNRIVAAWTALQMLFARIRS